MAVEPGTCTPGVFRHSWNDATAWHVLHRNGERPALLGVIPKEEPACTFLHTPDAGDFMRAVDTSPSWQDKGGHGIGSERSDDEVNPEVEEQRDLPDADNASLVEAELGLCSLLSTWSPWALPEKAVVEQLQSVAAAMSGGKQHAPHSFIVRQWVIKELQYEREHFAHHPRSVQISCCC